MKQTLLLALAFITISSVLAQSPGAINNERKGRLYGKVINSSTDKGLESVSVLIVNEVSDGINKKDSVIGGMFTRPNGDFSFENIPFYDSIKLVVTAVGFKNLEKRIALNERPGFQYREIDLGNYNVEPDAEVLKNVVVTATRPTLEMGLDRRVFNVEKSITSTGGTAIDIMRNIPSVTVDVEGNVLLRNSSPQIFVDGRPTILTLDQIPASDIEKVELITNPSAKFDASSTGGIINVVLKKNRRIGLNGNASVSGGIPRVIAGSLALNLRQGKFNFFVSGNYNQSGGIAKGETFRQNKKGGVIDNYFNQYTNNNRLRVFQSLRFGFDFFIDNRNILTISENLVTGEFSNDESQRQEYLNSQKLLERTGERTSDGEFSFNRSGTQLIYTHKFSTSGHQLTADATYNNGGRSNNSYIVNNYYYPDGSQYAPPNRVRNDGENNGEQVTIQLDYANPFGENKKFEAGIRSYIENSDSYFNAFAIGPNDEATKLPLSNNYKFKETVNAFYLTYANQIEKFTYQAGLRAEASKFEGELIDRGQKFGYNYPNKFKNIWNALFPSLFVTRNLREGEDIQVNYSRRIRRPNFWQLNPFIDINDPVNLRQGNPALRPEFTNSFELNYSKTYKSGTFLGAVYFRNTVGDVTRYSDTITEAQYEQLNNAAIDPNAILNTFINSDYQNRLGLDLTLQHRIGNNLEIIPNFNLQHRNVKAQVNDLNLSNQGWNWEMKLISNYKVEAPNSWLFKNLSFQLTGEYESPEVIPQGRRKAQYSMDFALRKDLFKENKGTLTFNIQDVFNSNRWGTIYDTEAFYQDSYRRWRVRTFRLTFSYRFGSSNFSLFRRMERGGNDRNNDDPGSADDRG